MNTNEENSKAWDFLIIILKYAPFGLVMQCNEYVHKAWKALIEKYEVSEEKKRFNDVMNRWNNYMIKYTSQDHNIWFNELFHVNLKLKKIKAKYKKY